ncbi:hypothetical protein ACFQ2B_04455 [Streptomyces stramineus]|uniref:Uncharacterized protein n=1 Tax=Streptomyces stramineus TaxID=173861 RepID=A0ABP3LD25_9ACTN
MTESETAAKGLPESWNEGIAVTGSWCAAHRRTPLLGTRPPGRCVIGPLNTALTFR